MTVVPRFDWQGHLLAMLATGAVGWFLTMMWPRDAELTWAALTSVYLLGATGLHVLRRLRRSSGRTGLTTGEMTAERLAEVEARLDRLESAEVRMAELEERLEFAERLLASGNSQAVAHEAEPRR